MHLCLSIFNKGFKIMQSNYKIPVLSLIYEYIRNIIMSISYLPKKCLIACLRCSFPMIVTKSHAAK